MWLRFTLRSILVVMTAVAGVSAWVKVEMREYERENRTLAEMNRRIESQLIIQ